MKVGFRDRGYENHGGGKHTRSLTGGIISLAKKGQVYVKDREKGDQAEARPIGAWNSKIGKKDWEGKKRSSTGYLQEVREVMREKGGEYIERGK